MAQRDWIAVNIPATDLEQIRAAIATLNAKLLPHLKVLTPQERQELPKMGDRTAPFVQKTMEYARAHPELVPAFLDLEALQTDVNAVQTLRELSIGLTPVAASLNDSMTLSGSEAYQGALVFYANVKTAAKVKTPYAQAVYDDLSARFPGAPTKAAPAKA